MYEIKTHTIGGSNMNFQEVKLSEISEEIIMGLPLRRYTNYDDENVNLIEKNVIKTKTIEDIDEPFEIEKVELSEDVQEKFYSKKHDILYKSPQHSFAKEIINETNAIIPYNYIIIRPDTTQVNSTFLTYYLNDKRVDYEIQRHINSTIIPKVSASILRDIKILLPPYEIQNQYGELITNIKQRIIEKRKSIELDDNLIASQYTNIIGDYYEK